MNQGLEIYVLDDRAGNCIVRAFPPARAPRATVCKTVRPFFLRRSRIATGNTHRRAERVFNTIGGAAQSNIAYQIDESPETLLVEAGARVFLGKNAFQ